MAWSRRAFLKGGGLALLSCGWGGTPLFLTRAAEAAEQTRRKVLVGLFQRGAMDGLMAVQPHGNESLEKLRPQLLLPRTGQGGLLHLDQRFGLHPAFEPIYRHFRDGSLAIVHGVGPPNTTRSHFDAQDYMETGTPFRKGTPSGWLNRASGMLGHEATPFRSVALTETIPRSLYGNEPTLAISSIEDFRLKTGRNNANSKANDSLEQLYREATQESLRRRGGEAFDAMDILGRKRYRSYRPAQGVRYPNSPLGRALRQIAFLIKSDVGLEIAFAESNGWDTHRGQGTANGVFARRAKDLASSIDAFWTDLGSRRSEVVLMTMTEFGRTVAQNGSGGTDHGRGSCMFVLGEKVKGGRVHGSVSTLEVETLADGRDLPVTTDFRAAFAGVAGPHLGIASDSRLFPNWKGRPLDLLG